jgi:predicted TPR repeat methyltransferase
MTAPDSPTVAQARAFFERGLQLLQEGRAAAAAAQFEGALALVPGRPSALTNLGAARLQAGQPAQAVEALQEAVEAEPGNVDAWGHLALAYAELGRRGPALQAAERALALEPRLGKLWALQADLLREAGELPGAIAAHEQALALGWQPELQRWYLDGLRGVRPPAPPQAYVRALFDGYAGDFDRHLVEVLQYRAPQLLAQGLQGRRHAAALDLGCGTGLCGPLLRPLAQRLEGLDLSPAMVEAARATGAYDEVLQGDVAGFLASTGRRYDLLVAADVFIYVGALDAVFAGAARVLQPGGTLCFSVEDSDAPQGWELRPSLRYAHGEAYIRSLAQQHGFNLRALSRHPLRIDRGQPLPGLYAWLDRQPSA